MACMTAYARVMYAAVERKVGKMVIKTPES